MDKIRAKFAYVSHVLLVPAVATELEKEGWYAAFRWPQNG